MGLKKYIKLMRPRHYLKNLLILLPLIFSGTFFETDHLVKIFYAFVSFSLVASLTYIINDINDAKLDRLHPKKRFRPIASREVSLGKAITLGLILLILAIIFQLAASTSVASMGLLALYLLINILYSFGFKNIPIVDVVILSSGFLIRVLYGGSVIGLDVSQWLCLVVLAFSFYLSLGKRRNEIKTNGHKTRVVNKYYTQEFLDKNMYVFSCLTVVFYSLWAVDLLKIHGLLFWTVPLVIVIMMSYSLSVEKGDSDGDPINVLTGNKVLIGLVLIYAVSIMVILYA